MTQTSPTPSPSGIAILWRDKHLLVVNKPSGLLTVPGRGPEKQDCLINRLLIGFPNSRIVHRLDQPTSGVLLIPQSHLAQKSLGQQFEQRQIHKQYQAMVAGKLTSSAGKIELPLLCDWPNRPKQMVDFAGGKKALTHYQLLEFNRDTNSSRVLLKPVTGRSHQLRVHMKALGHPILGDTLYAPHAVQRASKRLLLHAQTITFTHPVTLEPLTVHCPSDF